MTFDNPIAADALWHGVDLPPREGRAAFRKLGAKDLAGLAVGNEPDLFEIQPGLERERVRGTMPTATRGWTRSYSPTTYRRDYLAYARALAIAAPGVPLSGPEVTRPSPAWLHALTGLGRLSPGTITLHRYPLSTCWAKSSPQYPRISSLLSESSSAGLARPLQSLAASAHDLGMSFRVSEVNAISCGGHQDVTGSFATALWAPDALVEFLAAGVDGVNWHTRAQMPNSPFELIPGGIEPLPEPYGLALFTQMMGLDERLVEVRTSAAADVHVKVWAVRSRQETKVLLINKGPDAVRVTLAASPAGKAAQLERLSAPKITSRNGITLAHRAIGLDGRWHGEKVTTVIHPNNGGYHLRLPGYSAALLQAPHL